MTNSIELKLLSEDAASQTKTKVRKTSLMRASVLKHYKLKIKIVENKTSINKSYLYRFVPHLFVALLAIS